MFYLMIIFISITPCLGGITFNELSHVTLTNPIETEIRGFAYQDGEGRWILAEQPNLRSCCIGSSTKAFNQIYLETEITGLESNTPVHLVGTLSMFPTYDGDGKLKTYYHFAQANRIPSATPWATIGCVFLLIIGVAKVRSLYWT